ncbi:MAG: TonB-dependent receptor [Flavobacterium sp.]|nr:TonB-dependent receptor [Flavobacterium sp.]
MKNLKNWLLLMLFSLVSTVAFSQTKITGTVTDGELKGSLPGASVIVKGTSEGVTTDFDGKFTLITNAKSGELIISFVGYAAKTVSFKGEAGKTIVIGNIELESDSNTLEDIVVVGKGVIDLAKDRRTPIAVSTIKVSEIQAKVGSADITQTLVNTPSVYVAGQAGGFGDSRVNVRGFAQDNTAFLLNGQPINGMEDGKVYWSNWSGMSDIANGIQIQRGLGSSKLAISSVGGTVNFITKATDKRQGGFASFGLANNDYFKSTIGYNTGMNAKGWGMSVMFSHWQGDGYNYGTKGEGQSYFISVGYQPNSKHNFNFLLTGAPQEHDQNFTKTIKTYLDKGRRFNDNWGTLNGKYLSERTNFYHKPVANFNWDFNISDKTQLSTVLYASWGRGGGTGNYAKSSAKLRTPDGQIDFDGIYAFNKTAANGDGNPNNNYIIRSSMNNHSWYGLVSNLKTELTKNLNLNVGLDLRTYNGTHYRQVSNFLGLNSWTESRSLRDNTHQTVTAPVFNTVTDQMGTNPWTSMFSTMAENQRIDYDYSETITYGGVFGQLEYSDDKVSAFFQGAASNQSHSREDRYDYLPEFQKSEKVNNWGYNVKAGGSYNITENNSVYVNAGYYSRQPYHDNIYLNFTNAVNPLSSNEKILGLEAGYSFKSKFLSANLNAYRTTWKDRVTTTSSTTTADGVIGTTPIAAGSLIYKTNQGVEQVHTGLELDLIAKPFRQLEIKGFASVGNWKYKGEVVTTQRDESLNTLDEKREDVDGGKVGDAAQTTFGAGFKYEIVERVSFDADWRNYSKLYANVGAVKDNLELPSYNLVDAGFSYKMLVGKDKKNSVNFRINVNNLFNEIYLSELTSNIKTTANVNNTNPAQGTYQSTGRIYKGIADGNQGYFGFGRTWNVSLRYNF